MKYCYTIFFMFFWCCTTVVQAKLTLMEIHTIALKKPDKLFPAYRKSALIFSPNGTELCVNRLFIKPGPDAYNFHNQISVHDIKNLTASNFMFEVPNPNPNPNTVTDIKFSAINKVMAVVLADYRQLIINSSAVLYDFGGEGDSPKTHSLKGNGQTCMAFAPDKPDIAIDGSEKLQRFDIANPGNITLKIESSVESGQPWKITFTSGGELIAIGTYPYKEGSELSETFISVHTMNDTHILKEIYKKYNKAFVAGDMVVDPKSRWLATYDGRDYGSLFVFKLDINNMDESVPLDYFPFGKENPREVVFIASNGTGILMVGSNSYDKKADYADYADYVDYNKKAIAYRKAQIRSYKEGYIELFNMTDLKNLTMVGQIKTSPIESGAFNSERDILVLGFYDMPENKPIALYEIGEINHNDQLHNNVIMIALCVFLPYSIFNL